MGSLAAMRGYASDRYATGLLDTPSGGVDRSSGKLVPEGVEGRVAYKGMTADTIFQLVGGLRAGMGYVGAANLAELRERARFVHITSAGFIESHPHNVVIIKEPPNYQLQP